MSRSECSVNICHSHFFSRKGSMKASIHNGGSCLTSNKHNIKKGNANFERGAWFSAIKAKPVLPQAKHTMVIAGRALLLSNTEQTSGFKRPRLSSPWSSRSGNRSTVLSRKQSQELFWGSGHLPSLLCVKQFTAHLAARLVVGKQLGFSFCCAQWVSSWGWIAGVLVAVLKQSECVRHTARQLRGCLYCVWKMLIETIPLFLQACRNLKYLQWCY